MPTETLTTWDAGTNRVQLIRVSKLATDQALVRGKYRRLFSSRPCPKRSGPPGSDEALIQAIVDSSRAILGLAVHGSPASFVTFGIDNDGNVVHRVLAKYHRPAPGGNRTLVVVVHWPHRRQPQSVDLFRCESIVLGSYRVLVIMEQFTHRLVGFGVQWGDVTSADLCRLFNAAVHGRGYRDISVPITIRCSRHIGGRRT